MYNTFTSVRNILIHRSIENTVDLFPYPVSCGILEISGNVCLCSDTDSADSDEGAEGPTTSHDANAMYLIGHSALMELFRVSKCTTEK